MLQSKPCSPRQTAIIRDCHRQVPEAASPTLLSFLHGKTDLCTERQLDIICMLCCRLTECAKTWGENERTKGWVSRRSRWPYKTPTEGMDIFSKFWANRWPYEGIALHTGRNLTGSAPWLATPRSRGSPAGVSSPKQSTSPKASNSAQYSRRGSNSTLHSSRQASTPWRGELWNQNSGKASRLDAHQQPWST